jgi:hypothetical protein
VDVYTHACIAARLRVDTIEACSTACCTARLSVCGPVPLADFGLKLNWDALRDRLGVFHSVSEWNADKTRQGPLLAVVASMFRGMICAGRTLWRRLDLVMRIFCQHTNAGCLWWFVSFPGNPWSCQCPYGYGRYVKFYIHTYIHLQVLRDPQAYPDPQNGLGGRKAASIAWFVRPGSTPASLCLSVSA